MHKSTGTKRKKAIVIGGSMSGLLAARVLSDFYDGVTIIERDALPDHPEQRRGVPHGRHAHAILAGGQGVLERFFPGVSDELVRAGALLSDPTNDGTWFFEGGGLRRANGGTKAIQSSRPLLEGTIRSRLRKLTGVKILDDRPVEALTTGQRGEVTGVRTDKGNLDADLVVDASGRGSQTPKWLASLGFERPREERVGVDLTYTTRTFRRRRDHLNGDLFCLLAPTPDEKRGGVILAQEGDRWIVTLFGHFGQSAPTELDGYLRFAKSLPAPIIHDVIRDAEPIGEACTFRFPASARRRYEELDRFPAGFLVFGDAICSFNPIYGQGMSVASLQAEALREVLRGGDSVLALRFFRAAAKVIDNPWNIAVGSDLRMPEAVGPRTVGTRLINWYMAKLHKCAHTDTDAALAFIRVAQLLDGPAALMQPNMVWRILSNGLRTRLSAFLVGGMDEAIQDNR